MRMNYSFSLATSSLTPPRSMSISAGDGEVTSAIPAWNSPLALPKFRASSGILFAPKRKIAIIRRIINSVGPGDIFLRPWVWLSALKVFGIETSIFMVFLLTARNWG